MSLRAGGRGRARWGPQQANTIRVREVEVITGRATEPNRAEEHNLLRCLRMEITRVGYYNGCGGIGPQVVGTFGLIWTKFELNC